MYGPCMHVVSCCSVRYNGVVNTSWSYPSRWVLTPLVNWSLSLLPKCGSISKMFTASYPINPLESTTGVIQMQSKPIPWHKGLSRPRFVRDLMVVRSSLLKTKQSFCGAPDRHPREMVKDSPLHFWRLDLTLLC